MGGAELPCAEHAPCTLSQALGLRTLLRLGPLLTHVSQLWQSGFEQVAILLVHGRDKKSGAPSSSWSSSATTSDSETASAAVAGCKQSLHDARTEHGKRGVYMGVIRG